MSKVAACTSRGGRALTALAIFTCVVAPVSAGLFRVWVTQDAVQVGYALGEETARRRRLQDTLERLEVQLAAERAPERLTQLASSLGLRAPRPEQVLGRSGHGR